MADTAPIVVRYDAQNAESVIASGTKIVKTMDAMRTSTGQVTSSVKQMEQGFRADAFGNFANSVTNADTKVTGFRAKLTQVGTAFSQNATSFSVATASIWGVYNAYDSLEKVQIRAHAAATRVSTLETTIATLTQRRADAVAKGNISAEQLAILDERITNGHSKLAVAQERNADLQQDVNEAWGAFASQVGPQAIAAGGSIVQLVANLRGSMGGVIPSIKNFFSSFSGGGAVMAQTREQSLLLGQGIGNLKAPMEGAAVATRGLSLAMKGLLIGTGVGLAITAISLIAEHFMNTAEAAETNTNEIEGSLGDMNTAFDESGKNTLEWGRGMGDAVDTAAISVKNAVGGIVHSTDVLAAKQKMILAQMKVDRLEAEKEASVTPTKPADVRRQGRFGGMFQEAPADTEKITALDKQIVQAKDDAALAAEQFNNLANEVAAVATGADDMDALAQKTERLKNEASEIAKLPIGDRFKMWQDGKLEKSVVGVADAYEIFKNNYMNYHAATKDDATTTQKQIIAKENLQTVLKSNAQAFEESFNATTKDTDAEAEQNRVEQEALAIKKQIVTETFGVATATQKAGESNADYANRMSELSDIGQKRIDEEKQYTLGLIATAASLKLNETQQAALAEAMDEGNQAIVDLITSEQTLNDVLNDTDRTTLNIQKGQVAARTETLAFIDSIDQQIAKSALLKKDNEVLAAQFAEHLPQGITLTREQMLQLITTQDDMGAHAQVVADIMNTAFAETNAAVKEVIDAAVKGGKDWKEAWKDIKHLFPKSLRDDIHGFVEDQAELTNVLDETTTEIGLYSDAWNSFNPKEKDRAVKDMIDDIQELGEALQKTSDVDIEATITGPLIDLAANGLTDAELSIWREYVEKAKDLNKDGKLDDNDVKILQAWVAEHTGMKDLGDATGDTADSMKELTPEMQKIAENRQIKVQIDAISGALELQRTSYVEPLTEAYRELAKGILAIKLGGGGGGGNGFHNVSGVPGSDEPVPFMESRADDDKMGNVAIGADLTQWNEAVTQVKADVAEIDALAPIVDFKGDHRQFVKAGQEVLKAVSQIDALRPIVDFLGDHRQYMKAASDVLKQTAAIDKLRPIVDFMGDHSSSGNFMKVADEVEERVDEIDGMVATVTIKAKRVGDFSAQHGMDMYLTEDATIHAHKNEHVKITPPGSSIRPSAPSNNPQISSGGGSGSPRVLYVEMPVYIGRELITKMMREIPLEDTGMFPQS